MPGIGRTTQVPARAAGFKSVSASAQVLAVRWALKRQPQVFQAVLHIYTGGEKTFWKSQVEMMSPKL